MTDFVTVSLPRGAQAAPTTPLTQPARGLSRRDWGMVTMALGLGAVLAGCGQSAEDFSRLLTKVRGVSMGPDQAAQRWLVFFDTRCGYCTQLWRNLQAAPNTLQVIWVPVAILAPASQQEGEALLRSANPREWLTAHMAAPGRVADSAPASPESAAAAKASLAANLAALDGLPGSARSVPQTVGVKGNGLHVVRGALPADRLQAEFGA